MEDIPTILPAMAINIPGYPLAGESDVGYPNYPAGYTVIKILVYPQHSIDYNFSYLYTPPLFLDSYKDV
jgi:hypothetical protein